MVDRDDDFASELEIRDELLVACRELLARIGSSEAVALVRHIESVLDLDSY